jgi:large subunit ribosomal protein L21
VYAVVRTGGKQYRVEEGRAVKVNRLPGEPGDTVELGDVLLMGEGEAITIGAPTIAGARVVGTIAEQGRARKIVVFKYKSKTRSRKKTGHRQHFTRVLVEDILAAGQEPKPKAAAPVAAEEAVEAPKKSGRRKKDDSEAAASDAVAAAPDVTASEETSEPEPVDEAPAAEARTDEKPKRSRRKKDTE